MDRLKSRVCACAQSCPTLCDPKDCNPPGSSVCGILQARILECIAISFCRGSSQHRDQTRVSWVSCMGRQILYPLSHLGSPKNTFLFWMSITVADVKHYKYQTCVRLVCELEMLTGIVPCFSSQAYPPDPRNSRTLSHPSIPCDTSSSSWPISRAKEDVYRLSLCFNMNVKIK